MGNLSAREKFLTIAILLLIVIFGLQMFVLNPQKDKNKELNDEYTEYKNKKDYYDQLLAANDKNEATLQELNEDIKKMEVAFIPELNAESLEMWVMKKFEKAGCPYLISISISDVAEPSVVLPNGAIANDSLNVKRVEVSYSTTDGFNVPQYNYVPGRKEASWDSKDDNYLTYPEWLKKVAEGYQGVIAYREEIEDALAGAKTEEALQQVMEEVVKPITFQPIFGEENAPEMVGYDEFLKALAEIEKENEFAIKINSIEVVDSQGYLTLTATIDFYSANFSNRVSDVDLNKDYIQFTSDNPKHNVGLIGLPLYPVMNADSYWSGILLNINDINGLNRPFASYYSNALFNAYLEQYKSLALVLGIYGGVPTSANTVPDLDSEEFSEEGETPATEDEVVEEEA